jgi:uncharacterized membrane protein
MDISTLIKTIWPLVVIQLALQVYAIIDLIKKKKVKNLSVPIWILIIIFGEIIGACLYLLLGRTEEE